MHITRESEPELNSGHECLFSSVLCSVDYVAAGAAVANNSVEMRRLSNGRGKLENEPLSGYPLVNPDNDLLTLQCITYCAYYIFSLPS